MLCNFIEITFRHGCTPVNLLHAFRAPFSKNTSGRLLLNSNKTYSKSHFVYLYITGGGLHFEASLDWWKMTGFLYHLLTSDGMKIQDKTLLKKSSFLLRIFSVNMTIIRRNLWIWSRSMKKSLMEKTFVRQNTQCFKVLKIVGGLSA